MYSQQCLPLKRVNLMYSKQSIFLKNSFGFHQYGLSLAYAEKLVLGELLKQ